MSVNGPVVVGADGSSSSLEAVAAAAAEAELRGCPLRIVHAFTRPVTYVDLGPAAVGPFEGGLMNPAERIAADAAETARAAAPGLEIHSHVITGEPVAVLAEQSRDASLVVVGSRGLGKFTGVLIGSVGMHLTAHGSCPVLIVRGTPDPDGRIVLGVDGSPAGAAAVAFGFEEAARRGAGILAVHAWTPWNTEAAPPPDPAMPYANKPGALESQEECVLSEALAGLRDTYPDIPVEREVVRGGTREALIERSRGAGLLVVGARGRGGFAGMLLGSVSQAALQHAHCPVAVVRADASG